MIDTKELNELVAALTDYTPDDSAAFEDLCKELHRALDLKDEVTKAQDAATVELKAAMAAALEPFKAPMAAIIALQNAAKAACVRKIEADEAAIAAAIAAAKPVPGATQLPKGLSMRRETHAHVTDFNALPANFIIAVADMERILETVKSSGAQIPGVEVSLETSVVYKRPSKK
jgi:hypothetical protein